MEEQRIRTLVLEEVQGTINQIIEETEGNYSPMIVAAKNIGEIIERRLNRLKDKQATENEQNQDTEIGKDPV